MTKKLNNEAQYHSEESLVLRPVIKGAQMWSVNLERTMLTYFEINPNSRFDKHSHVNEQITMVLEGELFFEVQERIIRVKKGEVIAIPSSLPHAAFTKNSSVKAVDAWSPVIEKYKHKENCFLENETHLAHCPGMKP